MLDHGGGQSVRRKTWFGPPDQPLFGVVDTPANGMCRGAVVLCPPIGKAHVDSYRGMVLLSQELTARGLMTVRFDYRGVGDSTGAQDAPDAVEGWLKSIESAVAYARSCGAKEVALLGLGVGGLLSAAAVTRCGDLRALALWDPAENGRLYLRAQQALYRIAVGSDDVKDPRVSLVGTVLAPQARKALSGLDLHKIDAWSWGDMPVLVAMRQRATDTIRTLARTWNADELELHNHELFLEPEDFIVEMPSGNIVEIAYWLGSVFPAEQSVLQCSIRTSATVGHAADGTPIVETLSSTGEHDLFTMTTSLSEPDASAPAVIFYATAREHRIGPARLWVEAARELAVLGVQSVRFDRRGTGETGWVARDECTTIFTPESREDAVDIALSCNSAPQNMMFVGMCSGAWNACHAAMHVPARAVSLVNMTDWAIKRKQFVKRSTMQVANGSQSEKAADLLHRNVDAAVTSGQRVVLGKSGSAIVATPAARRLEVPIHQLPHRRPFALQPRHA